MPQTMTIRIFFGNVLSHLLSFECEDIILGGDLNLALDVQNDKGGRLTTHKNSLKEVQDIINSPDLMNIWRVSNPDIKRFTQRRSKPEIHCCLDFFLTSNSLSSGNYKSRYITRLQNRPFFDNDPPCKQYQSQGPGLLEDKYIFSIRQ